MNNRSLQWRRHERQFYRVLGEILQQKRKARKKTQDQVGEPIGLTRMSICNIESGRQRLSIAIFARICRELSTSAPRVLAAAGKKVRL